MLFCLSCVHKQDSLLGVWNVKSNFYKATCQIVKENNTYKGLVLYYNDDTSIYKHKEGDVKTYFFNNIKAENNQFVDAISGATIASSRLAELKLKHQDTLQVTTYIKQKPLTEIWIKQK